MSLNPILYGASWLALASWPLAANSQSTTVVADVGSVRSLGTTVLQNGSLLTIDGGARSGANLFHSFSQFSLGAGDTARWVRSGGDAASVSNVISRVTGGQISQIAGTLDSTGLPNASFFFINPAGIVFGGGARVNVPAAAYFSTAAELRFADAVSFAVSAPNGSTLSMAAPESFGFLGGQGAIEVRGAGGGFAPATVRLSFSGSDVGMANAGLNLASRMVVGGLDLIGVGSGADVVQLADPLARVHTGAVTVRNTAVVITSADRAAGALRISGGAVALDGADFISDAGGGARGGDIRVRADRLSVNKTTFSSNASGDGAGGDIFLAARTFDSRGMVAVSQASGAGAGGDLTIEASDLELVENLFVTGASGAGAPGDVAIFGDNISISGGNFGSSPGENSSSGNLTITGDISLKIFGSVLSVSTVNDGAAGVIALLSPDIYIESTLIDSNSFGVGAAGQVIIEGRDVYLNETRLEVESRGGSGGRLGLVRIGASRDILLKDSDISSNAFGQAGGGRVAIEGRDIALDNSRINSDSFGQGVGGVVSIKATRDFSMSNGAVSSDAGSTGAAGDVTLEAQTIHLGFSASISSDALDTGNAGKVTIQGGKIVLVDRASISSAAKQGTGNAGTVTIVSESLSLTDATIASDTRTSGAAGAVVIKTGDLLVDGNRRGFTTISSDTLGEGDAGGVTIEARSIILRNQGAVSSNSFNIGNAGRVSIQAGSLVVRDGSFIASDTNGPGHAGDVSILADSVLLAGNGDDITYISSDTLGGGNAGAVTITAKSLSVTVGAFISSDTYNTGDAGDIRVRAGVLTLDSEGDIRSGTFSSGNAGNVFVQADELTLDNGARISSEAYSQSGGNAGFIQVVADTLSIRDTQGFADRFSGAARVSTSSAGAGDAGAVMITAKRVLVDGGEIRSGVDVGSSGASGSLVIAADTVSISGGGSVATVSNNARRAGQIEITAGQLSVDGARSQISSENLAGAATLGNPRGQSGDAGSVVIKADGLTVSNGGRITTNAFGGAAGEITITIDRPGLLVLKGDQAPGVIQTSSGAATGGKITISDPLAIISNGGSILALGQQRGANVVIQSRYFINSTDRANTVEVDGDIRLETGLYDVSSGTVNRELSVLDASKVLRGQCPAARSTGAVSQLITRPVGPYVREPGFAHPQSRMAPVAAISGACP